MFVLGDMSIFGAFFAVFCWEMREDEAGFAAAAADLHQPIGVVNTLLLLLGSYAVVAALQAHRRDRPGPTAGWLRVATGTGFAFIAAKAVEYSLEISGGHTPGTNTFFTFYFVMTGVHLLHVVVGLVLLGTWSRRTRAGRRPSRVFVEAAAVYWHMVDLLWVVIFNLLYLGPLS
ncbi:cytochrome c oxidase subunit 3 [Nocardioides stalactiti]|uniref:cytochrome c oxidase subunit 3 n=1 Tax=Nocardioides stalactiti TaxID=2755356 RepID=UPI00160178A7|nr:cytochrome c oxidase subunit 3 [Nocardioides stalactiti]